MDVVIRIVSILGVLGFIFLLLFLNKLVIARYWAPGLARVAEEDGDDERSEQRVADGGDDGPGQ